MVQRLASAEEWDLLAISSMIGGLVFKKDPEREWHGTIRLFKDDHETHLWPSQ